MLALIRLYRRHLSEQIQSRRCRFQPTCSQYAYEAVDRYGLLAGGILAYRRVRRCNPRHPGGADPVG